MAPVWHATREAVKSALDAAETARNNVQVDRALSQATGAVEGLLKRRFRPELATRFFDWPNRQYARSWRLWLRADELIRADQLTAGGTILDPSEFFLDPDTGPPFDRIEINLGSAGAFTSGDTHQRAIAIVGLYGYRDIEETVGELTAQLAGTPEATAQVSWSTARIGVGDVLRVDDERMIVTERTMVDSLQTLQANLEDRKSVV